jgi:hypothetical protein
VQFIAHTGRKGSCGIWLSFGYFHGLSEPELHGLVLCQPCHLFVCDSSCAPTMHLAPLSTLPPLSSSEFYRQVPHYTHFLGKETQTRAVNSRILNKNSLSKYQTYFFSLPIQNRGDLFRSCIDLIHFSAEVPDWERHRKALHPRWHGGGLVAVHNAGWGVPPGRVGAASAVQASEGLDDRGSR